MNDARLGEFLVKIGLITPEQLHTAKEMLDAANGGSDSGKSKLTNIVVSLGFASAEELARLAATALRLPYVPLDKVNIPKKLVGLLNKEHARKAKGILVKVDGKKFYLATFDPTNVAAFDDLQFVLGGRVFPVVATEDEVIKAFGHYYTERIQFDRPFDLPQSDSLDFDKAEMFDIRAARAQKQAAAAKVDFTSSAQSSVNRKAAEDRLAAAAANTVQKKTAAGAPAQEAPRQRPALEIRDAAPGKPAQPAASVPAAAKPAAAPPPAAPKPAAAPAAPADEMPVIRDADDLAAPAAAQAEDLEVVELADGADGEVEILEGEAEGEVVSDLEEAPVELEDAPAPPPAPASADDLLALFGAMAFGIEPGTTSGVQASAEGDELAKLFMGALSGPDPFAPAAPADQPADMHQANDLAKELAHMLLDQNDFTA